ncbi:hypothetical protein [Arthrobacter sp. A5]|uniref:hypothetical protein n=1 Tax=Arthrobacter sp. A5 TaxID=576926 RepID=UPI003DA7D175
MNFARLYEAMEPSARDKRFRIASGLAMTALGMLAMVLVVFSRRDRGIDIAMDILFGLQSVFTLALGIYLASARGKARALVPVSGRWKKVMLVIVTVIGITAVGWSVIFEASQVAGTALWPNMVALWVFLLFGPAVERFALNEHWTSGLTSRQALDTLAQSFHVPGLSADIVGQDVWVKIDREWSAGTWSHRDAGRYMKSQPSLRFQVDDTEGKPELPHTAVTGRWPVCMTCSGSQMR